MGEIEKEIKLLKNYFSKRAEVSMAFIFGSWAKGQEMLESDFDIGVYFNPKDLPEDGKKRFEIEDKISSEISRLIPDKNIDLVCLNIAPASLISDVIKTGIPVIVKDKKLYWETYLKNSLEAEDFLYFAQDYFKIYKQSESLTPEQKDRILVRWQFLDEELKEIKSFEKLTFQEYQNNKIQRRNVDRWTENIINATIDIAKIVLASEKRFMPKSYKEALRDFGFLVGLNEEEAEKFSKIADLRNILVHEYLDILYQRIENFIKEFPLLYQRISKFLEKYLKEK